jgi:hypothetical protein
MGVASGELCMSDVGVLVIPHCGAVWYFDQRKGMAAPGIRAGELWTRDVLTVSIFVGRTLTRAFWDMYETCTPNLVVSIDILIILDVFAVVRSCSSLLDPSRRGPPGGWTS